MDRSAYLHRCPTHVTASQTQLTELDDGSALTQERLYHFPFLSPNICLCLQSKGQLRAAGRRGGHGNHFLSGPASTKISVLKSALSSVLRTFGRNVFKGFCFINWRCSFISSEANTVYQYTFAKNMKNETTPVQISTIQQPRAMDKLGKVL